MATLPGAPFRARRAALLAAVAGLALGLVLLVGSGNSPMRIAPGPGAPAGTFDALAYHAGSAAALEAAATDGLSHVLYTKSPGGVLAAARRTAAFRPQIEAAARSGPIDADTIEAIVLLESAGRPDVVAGTDLSAAAGLTQIVAQTGSGLLGMHVDLAASRRLAAEIAAAPPGRAAALRAQRARVDQRFDPAVALAATERYLADAKRVLGRDDLAVESYHMGIGNLQTALRHYGGSGDVSYTQLYFDSTPLAHPAAHDWLAALGDDSATYLWRVDAARAAMRLYRSDPAALAARAALDTAGPSAELALRPPASTPFLADAASVAAARRSGALVAPGSSSGLRATGPLYLRPEALALARYMAAGVRRIGRSPAPLLLTAATTGAADLASAAGAAHGLADRDPTHATGYAFDVARSYATPAQALALQFMLDRLQVLDVIAWRRHARIIHVVVGPRVRQLVSG